MTTDPNALGELHVGQTLYRAITIVVGNGNEDEYSHPIAARVDVLEYVVCRLTPSGTWVLSCDAHPELPRSWVGSTSRRFSLTETGALLKLLRRKNSHVWRVQRHLRRAEVTRDAAETACGRAGVVVGPRPPITTETP